MIQKPGLRIEFRHQEGFEMLIWRCIYIYNLSKYKIIDKLKMLSTARAIAWREIFARYRPPCYAFHFDVAFVHFELRLTEKRSIETSHKVFSAFCDREWVSRSVFSGWTGCTYLRTYLLTYAHNLISKPHSVPPYTLYTTELVVAGLKQYWTTSAVRFVPAFRSDAGSLASLGRRGL